MLIAVKLNGNCRSKKQMKIFIQAIVHKFAIILIVTMKHLQIQRRNLQYQTNMSGKFSEQIRKSQQKSKMLRKSQKNEQEAFKFTLQINKAIKQLRKNRKMITLMFTLRASMPTGLLSDTNAFIDSFCPQHQCSLENILKYILRQEQQSIQTSEKLINPYERFDRCILLLNQLNSFLLVLKERIQKIEKTFNRLNQEEKKRKGEELKKARVLFKFTFKKMIDLWQAR